MNANVKNKVRQLMTELLTLSVGQFWASIIVDHIFNDVVDEMEHTMGEDISEDDVTMESVQSRMGKVLERITYGF